jgi:SAM-dependent methyltransferase
MPSDADNIAGLYERHARAYDRLRGRDLFERAWLDRFAALLSHDGCVLDIGCGMGEPIAGYFIGRGFAVTGIDSSARLIALCKERFPAQTWLREDMRKLALDSFFHLTPEDQRGMFAVFREHATPKAALMFTSGPSHGVAIGDFEGEPLYHASLDESEYRTLLSANSFAVLSYMAEDPQCGGHTIWLARRL